MPLRVDRPPFFGPADEIIHRAHRAIAVEDDERQVLGGQFFLSPPRARAAGSRQDAGGVPVAVDRPAEEVCLTCITHVLADRRCYVGAGRTKPLGRSAADALPGEQHHNDKPQARR